MFRTLRAQIALLAILPVLGLLAIGIFSLTRPFGIMSQATILLPLTDAVGTSGDIVTEILKETDATAAALAGKAGDEASAVLARQRAATDTQIQRLETIFRDTPLLGISPELTKAAEDVRRTITGLRELRGVVDKRGLPGPLTVEKYGTLTERLLPFQTVAAKVSPSDEIGDLLRNFGKLIAVEHYAGLERASGAGFFKGIESDALDLQLFSRTMGARAVQAAYLADLALSLREPERTDLTKAMAGAAITDLERTRGIIEDYPDTRDRGDLNAKIWFDQATARMDVLAKVGKTFITAAGRIAAAEIAEAKQAFIWGACTLAAAILLIAGFAIWRALGISARITDLAERMRLIAENRIDVEVPGINKADEIGQMARAVCIFRDNAVEKLRLEGMTAEQRQEVEDERRKAEARQAAAAAEQEHVLDAIATGLGRLAEGELTYSLAHLPGSYAKLERDFNAAVTQLREAMTEIARNTRAIHAGTGEISHAAVDLSRRTEQQAASLEETAAALDQITATVTRTAAGANEAQHVVSEARIEAEQSGIVVRSTVDAMAAIERSSDQIGQIIGVIDEIAFQTNLLALNAGVEAARAGDAGRGFAVVAQEVRALAQRSAEAAKEIKGLIGASTRHVSSGVQLVNETGQTLSRIVAKVMQINGIVAEIAASAGEQATGLAEVNAAMNQMDQVTQQNAAMVEQSTAASQALALEAEGLTTLIERFQIGVVADEHPRTAAPAKTRTPATPRPASMTRQHGNLALVASQPSENEWEDF